MVTTTKTGTTGKPPRKSAAKANTATRRPGTRRASRHEGAEPPCAAPRDDVAVAAYYRAERRGFVPGAELDDWLAAERELAREHTTPAE